jgi:hypothetical protein
LESEPIVDASGGTALVLWRKDRVLCFAGCERLEARKLTPDSPTRRMVASSCDAPMFLDFSKRFWLSVFRTRVDDAPPPSIHAMTVDQQEGIALPDDGLPCVRKHSGAFMLKLLATRASTGFRRPKVAGLAD